jgi:hypothetical protein
MDETVRSPTEAEEKEPRSDVTVFSVCKTPQIDTAPTELSPDDGLIESTFKLDDRKMPPPFMSVNSSVRMP